MDKAKPDAPMVSVIIPCLNDAATIGLVLAALNQQTYPRVRTEILVVDNGSTDGSPRVAAQGADQVLVEPVRSSYVARNRGISVAQGRYLLFLDADTVPCPAWIEALVRAAEESGSPLVGGRIENEVTHFTLGSRLLAFTRNAEHRRAGVEQHGSLSGGNMLVGREIFERCGPFLPVRSGGDGELARRANPSGSPVPYAAEAVVHHLCNISTWSYLCRAFRIARGQAVTRHRSAKGRPSLPWRPGPRRAKDVARHFRKEAGVNAGRFLFLQLLAVLWAERWFFYFGSVGGRFFSRSTGRGA